MSKKHDLKQIFKDMKQASEDRAKSKKVDLPDILPTPGLKPVFNITVDITKAMEELNKLEEDMARSIMLENTSPRAISAHQFIQSMFERRMQHEMVQSRVVMGWPYQWDAPDNMTTGIDPAMTPEHIVIIKTEDKKEVPIIETKKRKFKLDD